MGGSAFALLCAIPFRPPLSRRRTNHARRLSVLAARLRDFMDVETAHFRFLIVEISFREILLSAFMRGGGGSGFHYVLSCPGSLCGAIWSTLVFTLRDACGVVYAITMG